MSQTLTDRILADLRSAEWTCSREWASWTVSYSQRISLDLAKRGFVVKARVCRRPEHQHRSARREYRLAFDPERQPQQIELIA